MFRRRCALIFVLSLPWSVASAAPVKVGEADYQRIVALKSPAIAPDGKRVVVLVTRILWNDDTRSTDLMGIDLATGAMQTLVSHREGISDPAFSPDGTRLAFLAKDHSGKEVHTQIFVMPAGGGEAQMVTHNDADVAEFSWRLDGRALAYAAADSQPARTGPDRFRDSFIFTTEPITARDSPRPVHLFAISFDDGMTTQLTFGPQSVGDDSTISWSPDGRTIAFTLCRNAILNDQSYSRAALVDVGSKKVRFLTGRTMWEGDPVFSPDGATSRTPSQTATRKSTLHSST